MLESKKQISKSEAYYVKAKIIEFTSTASGGQVSYNLPSDFVDDCIERNILVENEEYTNKWDKGKVFILNDIYKFILEDNLKTYITSVNEEHKLFVIKAKSNGKPQLIRTLYNELAKGKDGNSYKWFSELYNNNIKDNYLTFNVDTHRKIFFVDIHDYLSDSETEIVTVEETEEDLYNDNLLENIQRIYFGPPGTGKSYEVTKLVKRVYPNYNESDDNSEFVFRTTIHSEYTYHDFVGNIMPKVEKDEDGDTKSITYDFIPGIFTKALVSALLNSKENVFLILEEMSRGNIVAIFGDIFQLLDRDFQGRSEYKIKNDLILDSGKEKLKVLLDEGVDINNPFAGHEIYLPPNLHIIGTVNTSDQNVFVMDNAFKRRFEFEYIGLDPIIKEEGDGYLNEYEFELDKKYKISWIKFYEKLNNFIIVELQMQEDKQIGQFFIKFKEDDDEYNYRQIYNKLLQYLWNDIHLTNMSNKSLIKKGINSFGEAYKLLKNHENIFNEELISSFLIFKDE